MQRATKAAHYASNPQAAVMQNTQPFLHTLHQHTHGRKKQKKAKAKEKKKRKHVGKITDLPCAHKQ